MGSFVPTTPSERQQMLKTIGVGSVEELFRDVPQKMRIDGYLDLPSGKSEMETLESVSALAEKNHVFRTCLRGAGSYRHYIPAAVKAIVNREEFVTAYTPYQAEISQGILQAIFEYQTMLCELTGMDVSNACVYDGGTAAAESITMCRDRKRTKAYVSATTDPQVIEVMKTYCFGSDVELTVVPQKNGRTDPGPLRERARSLFISQATIDETLEWATPRQLDAIDRMLATELANREASKRARLMRQARFPVPKSLDGYDFANVRLPDGYTKEQLTGLDFAAKAQDLVFYGKTGRGKTHLATALGMLAIEQGRSVRFRQTAELVLQLGKAKRDGALDSLLRDLARADLIILDEFGYVPFDIDGARLLYQIIAGSYERRSIIFTTNIEFSKWGTIFADDKLAAAIIDRIVHHGRLIEFTGPSRRVSQALMFGKTDNQ